MSRGRYAAEKLKERGSWSSEKGQSAVELAIVVPIVIVLLLAVADFGRVFFVSVAVNNAARAGAQYGSQSVITAADASGMKAAATKDASNISNWNIPTASQCTCVTVAPQRPAKCPGSYCTNAPQATYVTVNTSATFTTILALQYIGIPSTMNLTGQAIMQVQE